MGAISSVWPSGLALATTAAPTEPPAPGRFSITTDTPRACETSGMIVRGKRSEVLPGGNGTTSVIGRAILRYFPIDLLTIITPPTYRQAAP